jgi:hypothetical protein
MTKGPLSFIRSLLRSGEVSPLLPTRRIPEQAEELLRGKTGRPHELFGELRKIAPRNVLNLLYSDVMAARPKDVIKGEEFASSFIAPEFRFERPLSKILPSDIIAAYQKQHGDTKLADQMLSEFGRSADQLDRAYESNQAFRREFDSKYQDLGREIVPKPFITKPFEDYQRGPMHDNYFERILTSNDPLIYRLPEEAFETQHFDVRRPALGHVRGSVLPRGNNDFMIVDELQSDLLSQIEKLRFNPNFKSMKTPGSLEGIYGRLASGTLQQGARSGINNFDFVTPEAAKAIRGVSPEDIKETMRQLEKARKRGDDTLASNIESRLDFQMSNANKLDKIYGDTLEREFYEPIQREFGLRPYTSHMDVRLEDLGDVELPYRTISLTPEIAEQITRRGIPGFRLGGLSALR